MATSSYYTCQGSVRGGCGVHHRTHLAAYRHCRRDILDCASLSRPGSLTRTYSDRHVVAVGREEGREEDYLDYYWGHDRRTDA